MSQRRNTKKSAQLEALESTFERHTRRFSPFDILGLRDNEAEATDTETPEGVAPTHTGVDTTHTHYPHTHMEEGGTPPPGVGIHPKVVVNNKIHTTLEEPPTGGSVAPTHTGVDTTHIHDLPMHDVLAAAQLRTQLGQKARRVLGYLNSIRSLERTAYTVAVGYAQISDAADVHAHYLRRNVLPKLAMLGLIGIAHKSLQGTTYHLPHDRGFVHIVACEDDELQAGEPTLVTEQPFLPLIESSSVGYDIPSWLDREHWGWMASEAVQQLVAKAGSVELACEKLDIILYNETHGPENRRVRDRRAVLAHYLRAPQSDIWPNDDGYETLALRQARQRRDQALQEKALAEEALRARQAAARARFLASLSDAQLQWLKQQAKESVDARPDAKFLKSRYQLYKAEEEELVREWMDRSEYGEIVPHIEAENPEGEGACDA